MARRTRQKVSSRPASDEFAESLAAIRKEYGENTVTRASQTHQPERISTGVFLLDFALLGGIPHNRVSMFVGERHAGKSMLSDMVIASAQRQYPDSVVVKVDIEGTSDEVWSSKLGVDLERMYVVKPETGEAAVEATDTFVRTKEVSLVVVDSIAALTPMKEIESDAGDALPGIQARLVGGMIRKVSAGLIAERNRGHFVTVLFINQFRSKIGVVYGDPRTIPGGRALEFATSVQLIIKNKEKISKDSYDVETVEENEHAFDIKKNKLNGGLRTGEFRVRRILDPDTGLEEGQVDDAATMLMYAKKFGAYTGGGSSWTLSFWDEERKFRGLSDAVVSLYQDAELYWGLRNFLIAEQARHLNMPESFYSRFYPEE